MPCWYEGLIRWFSDARVWQRALGTASIGLARSIAHNVRHLAQVCPKQHDTQNQPARSRCGLFVRYGRGGTATRLSRSFFSNTASVGSCTAIPKINSAPWLAAAAAPQEAVNEPRPLADMRVQRNPVQLVAQDRVGGDFLPRAAVIGLPLTVEPLTCLGRPAVTVPFVAIAARPAGFRFKFAIPVVILRVAVAMVATLRACRLIHDDDTREGHQHNQHEERNVAAAHLCGIHHGRPATEPEPG